MSWKRKRQLHTNFQTQEKGMRFEPWAPRLASGDELGIQNNKAHKMN
jgi:hypothetical protein